jgi:hypothetical protein
MLAIPCFGYRGFDSTEFLSVFAQDFAVSGEIILFQGRCTQGAFRVEKPR